MQIYADILDRPLKVAKSDQDLRCWSCSFGASINEGFDIFELRDNCALIRDKIYQPNPEAVKIYRKLYFIYRSSRCIWHRGLAGKSFESYERFD